MQQRQRDRFPLREGVDGDGFAVDGSRWKAEVGERGEGGDGRRGEEGPVVRQDVYGEVQGPHRAGGKQAEGFGGESGGAAQGDVEVVRQGGF